MISLPYICLALLLLCLPFICNIHLLLPVSQTSKSNIIFCNHFKPIIFSKLMSHKKKISKPTSLVDFGDNVKGVTIFSPLRNYALKWGAVSSHPKSWELWNTHTYLTPWQQKPPWVWPQILLLMESLPSFTSPSLPLIMMSPFYAGTLPH